jgi:hypothetical protein
VSWAALWAAEILDRPTAKMRPAPINKHIKPAAKRVEITLEFCSVVVVMSPSVRPVSNFAVVGRSPDLRVDSFKVPSRFAISGVSVVITSKPHRLQLRGQSRFWPLLGRPHRIPS